MKAMFIQSGNPFFQPPLWLRQKGFILGWLCVLAASSAVEAQTPSAEAWTREHLNELVALYRELHAHPELSFEERDTARRLAARWESAGFEVTRNVGGHGVVGVLKNGSGPTLMLRTDLDALPVAEQTGLAFSSKVKVPSPAGGEVSVMHACGHDVHMTNLVGVAQFMSEHRSAWAGTLVVIGQPAEERGAGAKAMLEDGLFERFPKPDLAVALHVDATLAAGLVGVRSGYALANVDSVDVKLVGKGGHGAQPHTTIDPIVQAARLVLDLQTIVSREIKPTEPAVITVGSIHGGTKHNIIGNECHLEITVRSYSSKVRRQLLDGIRRKAQAVAMSAGADEPVVTISEGTPSLFNDEDLTARVRSVFERALGADRVIESEPSMGGEDFSRYGLAGVPIVMYRLGVVEARRLARYADLGVPPPSLHSSIFYPDVEPSLVTGVSSMASAALELLKP